MGEYLNGFPDIKLLRNEWEGACPGTPLGISWKVLLSTSYHRELQYIWVKGGDLNGFQDIHPFMK